MVALALTASFAGPVGGTVTESTPHYDLELLYHQHDIENGLAAAKAKLAANPNDSDLYWHVVRFMFEVGETIPRDDKSFDKIGLYEEMAEIAEKGLTIAPGDPHLLFARGIAYGRLGTTRGVLSSLFLAQTVEDSWLATANAEGYFYQSIGKEETLPCDAYLTLGIFYRLVPEAWIVQAIAGTRGDLQKSVDYQGKATECNPNSINTAKEYGVSLACFGEKRGDGASIEAAKRQWSRALAFPVVEPTDTIDKQHLAMLMADTSLACGYSRDGQQDLDEAKLAKEDK